jgi:hypothetical protein
MLIPGFNDATHRAVVWICDQLPVEVQGQQLVQAPGTCLAAGWPPPSARWAGLPPPARGSLSPDTYGQPARPGSYEGHAAGAGAAPPVAMQYRAAAAAQGRDPFLAPLTTAELAPSPSANIKQARARAAAQGPGPSLTGSSPDVLTELMLDPYGDVEGVGSLSAEEVQIRDVDAFATAGH